MQFVEECIASETYNYKSNRARENKETISRTSTNQIKNKLIHGENLREDQRRGNDNTVAVLVKEREGLLEREPLLVRQPVHATANP